MKICVYGRGRLGYVTAACLAQYQLVELFDWQEDTRLLEDELNLYENIATVQQRRRLVFNTNPSCISTARIVWITLDTPLDEYGHGQYAWLRAQIDRIQPYVQENMLVVLSSPVQVGFTRELEHDWQQRQPSLRFVYSPENIRKGHGIDDFLHQSRIVVGLGTHTTRELPEWLFTPFTRHIEWMSLEASEMTKHAVNGFLSISAAYANEIGRVCQKLGIDYSEVERALRSEPRIGEYAYISSNQPITGGSLLREIQNLCALATQEQLEVPVINAVIPSNDIQLRW